jgi:hypothetical protein
VHLFDSAELVSTSAKLQVTIELLQDIRQKGEKAMVFADRKATQKMLQKVFADTFDIPPPSIINGDTPSSRQNPDGGRHSRQQTIDRFQAKEGFNVIIMSQLAAGVGLNVVEANHVIHYSRHWNPAKEEQATDRAYRIGQTRDVYVYFPMAVFPDNFLNEKGMRHRSFDEVLDALLIKKQSLASSTLFPTEQSEVKPEELFEDVFEPVSAKTSEPPLRYSDINKLSQPLFEAFGAALLMKMGYETHLTPLESDKGADIIAIGNKDNLLLLALSGSNIIGSVAIEEVARSKQYYESKYNTRFRCAVMTTDFFNDDAVKEAAERDILRIDSSVLEGYLSEYPVTRKEMVLQEAKRMTTV